MGFEKAVVGGRKVRARLAIQSMTEADIERFWAKVNKEPGQGPRGKCWEWFGATDGKGYGLFWVGGRHKINVRAHRVAYFLEHGELPPPEKPLVCHECDNPPCCNPDCLWPGTNADNIRDRDAKGRQKSLGGELNGNASLTDGEAEAIVSAVAAGELRCVVAARFGISGAQVGNIVSGKQRKHLHGNKERGTAE